MHQLEYSNLKTDTNLLPHFSAYMHALPFVQGKRVIDLCCGTGYGMRLMSEVAKSVKGYDIAVSSTGVGTYMDLDKKLPDDKCDVVTCMQGLEHLEDPKKVINHFQGKTFIFALPKGGEQVYGHHYHVNEELIYEWFDDRVKLRYMDNDGNIYLQKPEQFSDYWGYICLN